MNILIAEDDAALRLMLHSLLSAWGYNVTSACDGEEAWKILCEPEHPHLAVLDWMMPGIEGPEIVRRLRKRDPQNPYYSIIITSRSNKDSAARALNSGADDFIGKPFDADELRARVAVGYRMNCLQKALSDHIQDLRNTLNRVKQLEGIIPICMYCKKIRDDHNDWNQLEQYITDHSEALFSHGICPHCAEEQMEIIQNLK
ncbi:MAG: response regulator transcription factor [Desulfuromonadales bacterium]